jgi:hypothetical protein
VNSTPRVAQERWIHQSMAAEAIMIALLALGWRTFDAEPRQ